MKEKVSIQCENIILEGVYNSISDKKAVVITHPHPLYGGNMNNHVVLAMEQVFAEKKYSTLCFNFRGTQNSSGMFDNGEGEQDDVLAAVEFLAGRSYANITLAGYSFGSRINADVVSRGFDVKDHIMVSPPVAFMSFNDIETLSDTGLIITGENDDIGPPDQIKNHIEKWNLKTKFIVIEGGDHFYSACIDDLQHNLSEYLK